MFTPLVGHKGIYPITEDDWLGGEAWSFGVPTTSTTISAPTAKTQLAKELLLLAVRLEDLSKDLDAIRKRLERL